MRFMALVPLVLVVFGCGDDGPASADAGGQADDAASADASPVDAGLPDAFDPCPGKTTFQVGVVDWVSNQNLPGVSVQEGDTANIVSSAPNGRVVLCVPPTGELNIHFTHADYLDRTHSTTGELITEQAAADEVLVFRLLTGAQADALYAGVGKSRAIDASTVVAMVRSQGSEAAGATVDLQASNEGAYTPGATPDALVAGNETQVDGRVLFLNTGIGGGSTMASASGLAGCDMPSLDLLADGISSVTISCEP